MNQSPGPGRIVGFAFLAIVVVAIAGLLAGYGVPIGLGALAGFILGGIAGLLGFVWLLRGPGRTLQLGGMSWSSSSTSGETGPSMSELRDMTELTQMDLGPIERVMPVLARSEASGYALLLVAIELHEAGVAMTVDVRSRPGTRPPAFMAEVTIHDDVGTTYRAAGQVSGSGQIAVRYLVAGVPAVPSDARSLEIRIERLMDPFPDRRLATTGPWLFTVPLRGGFADR